MKKLLIIEDDASFAEEMRQQLSAQHQVEVCPDGQSGYYAIYEYKPDAVLLDLTIEQMSAVSLIGKIKAQKQFNRLPIFVLADHKTLSVADEALAAGANEAFLKDDADALDRVVSALENFMAPSLARHVRKAAGPAVLEHATHAGNGATHPPAISNDSPAQILSTPRTVAAAPEPSGGSPGPSYPLSITNQRLNANFQQTAALDDRISLGWVEGSVSAAAQAFLDTYGPSAHLLRKDFIVYRTAQAQDRKPAFEKFLKGLSSFNSDAKQAGFTGLSLYLSAIELRVSQLLSCLDVITAPSLQILAAALDVLAALDNHTGELRPLNNMTPHALVVDDENVSRKALCLGLEKAKIKSTSVDNPDAAIHEAEGTPFDVIFLDVELPKMNGFALCARIRLFPAHRKTPILFVTSLSDMKSRASSRVSGGNQFLTKPLNYPELTVNAWTLVIRKRILEDNRVERARA